MTDVLIVGAGTAGLTAAVYAARAGKSVKLVEQYLQGGQIINASHVENFPGFESIAGFEFAEALYNQAIKMGAEIVYDKVTGLQDYGSHKGVQTEYGGELLAKAVILATGARVRPLGLENEDRFIGSGVSYCATCDGAFFKDKNVAVVGGGNTALDDALVLSFTSKKVYLIHRSDTFSGEKRLLEKLQEHDNVVFILDSEVTAINGSERLESLGIRNKVSGEEQTLELRVAPEDMGKVIGRQGRIAKEIPFLSLSAMFRIIKLSRLWLSWTLMVTLKLMKIVRLPVPAFMLPATAALKRCAS